MHRCKHKNQRDADDDDDDDDDDMISPEVSVLSFELCQCNERHFYRRLTNS